MFKKQLIRHISGLFNYRAFMEKVNPERAKQFDQFTRFGVGGDRFIRVQLYFSLFEFTFSLCRF